MAAVTVIKPDRALIGVFGPFKMEVVQISAANNDDTYESKLVNPSFAILFPAADAGGTSTNASATVSGKTITLRDPPTSASTLIVFGDSLS